MSEVINQPVPSVNYSLGKLYDFCAHKLPQMRTSKGILDVPAMADAMGLSREGVYKCFRSNRMTAGIAKKLIEISDGRIEPTEVIEFVIG
jgi:hypothetical protein